MLHHTIDNGRTRKLRSLSLSDMCLCLAISLVGYCLLKFLSFRWYSHKLCNIQNRYTITGSIQLNPVCLISMNDIVKTNLTRIFVTSIKRGIYLKRLF